MIHKLLFVCLLLSLDACHYSKTTQEANEETVNDVTTVYLVRHAEKESGSDPVLTPEGEARAQRLAEMLADKEIDAVFSTKFRRTQMTAEPVAKDQELEITDYDASDLKAFAKKLKREYKGKTVLVVGHSNTTPTLTGLLDGTNAYPPFDESDYSNLMMVQIPKRARATMEKMTF
jgi:broad specificity phosphatase PhoE